MSLDFPLVAFGLGLGAVCGFFNAVASGGSAVMFPALLAIGMPADVATATARLPILLGSTTALWSFERAKLIPWQSVLQRFGGASEHGILSGSLDWRSTSDIGASQPQDSAVGFFEVRHARA